MKYFTLLLFMFYFIGCEKSSKEKPADSVKSKVTGQAKSNKQNHEIDCEEFFRRVVFSSDLSAIKNHKNVLLKIENIADDKIVLQLYVKNPHDNGKITENSVAWLHFTPFSEKLFDITADPENPTEVIFNREILKKSDFGKVCGLKTDKLQNSTDDSEKMSCKELTGDMYHGEECVIKSQSLDNVYNEILEKSSVTDSKFLLKKLPKINTSEKINKNGIIEISYKINQNSVIIEMFYEGGITDIELYRENQSVKRIIGYNPD